MKMKATILLLLFGLTASLTASPARAKGSAACRQRCDKGNLGLVCWDGANLLVCSTKGYIAIDKSKYQGPAGPAGAIGPQGRPGERGPEGLTGLQGPTGPHGPQGADGAQGFQGTKGDTGPAGPSGPRGDTGPAGPEGARGDVGPVGNTGSPGAPGAIGATGLSALINQTILAEGDPTCPAGGVQITTQLSDGSHLQTTILCSGIPLPAEPPIIGPAVLSSVPSATEMPGSNFAAVRSGTILGYYSVSVSPDATSASIVFDLPDGVSVPPTLLFFDTATQTWVPIQSASAPIFSAANHTLTIVINGASVPSIVQLNN